MIILSFNQIYPSSSSINNNMKKLCTYLAILLLSYFANTQYTTIAIVATNDIHGAALPTQMQRQDNNQNYTYGGLMYMGSLIEIIKSEYPQHTLILDAGDQFQGGIQSSPLISSGKIMNDFFDAIGVSGSAIGNHEFDFGPDVLLPFLGFKQAPTLAANIRSERGAAEFLPRQKLSQMYEFKSGIRIGVIGLSTIFTPDTTNAFKDKKFPQYKFLNYTAIVIQQSKKLKKNGANAVLIVGHLGNGCEISNKYGKWTADSTQEPCDMNDQATQLIDSLPAGTIDGLLQGHRHKFAHHFRKGIPYSGTINGGYYFNVLYLKFNKKVLIQKMIEGPIPVCEQVFQKLSTCEFVPKDKLKIAGQLIPFRFHNKQVKPHPKIKAIYEQQWIPKMQQFLEFIVSNQIYMESSTEQQNQLSNLITTLMHDAVPQSEFVIINPGGLRTQWYPGTIQYQHLYNMFPFINYLVSFDITGSQLLEMLTIVQGGALGYYPMYGVDQVVSSANKKHSFISAKMRDGSEIVPDRVYRGLSIDFLLNGGDDFKTFIGSKYTPRNTKNHGMIRDLIRKPLQDLKIIKTGSLIDPEHPRLIVLK